MSTDIVSPLVPLGPVLEHVRDGLQDEVAALIDLIAAHNEALDKAREALSKRRRELDAVYDLLSAIEPDADSLGFVPDNTPGGDAHG